MWLLGVAFLLAGAYLLYFEAGLSRWISIGVLLAGFLLFVGLAVMSFSSSAPEETRRATIVREERPVVVENHPTYVERDDRLLR